jgi:prepilin-type N-terminal cleavage/methylation domain-containing protein
LTKRAYGFSLIELLVAMAVMVTVSGALMSLILAGESIARAEPEAADLQQRARVALQTLGAELALAGAGLDRGPQAGMLAQFFPPIAPSSDGGLTIWYVSSREAQATLAVPLADGATDAILQNGGNCPATITGCAFTPDTTAIVFDAHGCRDVLRVDDVTAVSLGLRAARQLMRRDEATGATVPVLDNVAAMSVEVVDAGRRVRVTLRLVTPTPNPMVPDFLISYDALPPNLQER